MSDLVKIALSSRTVALLQELTPVQLPRVLDTDPATGGWIGRIRPEAYERLQVYKQPGESDDDVVREWVRVLVVLGERRAAE